MVVIKNHALEMDGKWAAFFDATPVQYIGILGPAKRCEKIRAGMKSGNVERVHGPAGLDIGAEGAEQIALSILAQMLSICSGRDARDLRERNAPIHVR
jgi:xanthine/CO dehydrogenase XdhC/CoxF family maturation factor